METRSADSSLCWGIVYAVCVCISYGFFYTSFATKSQHTRAHSVFDEFYAVNLIGIVCTLQLVSAHCRSIRLVIFWRKNAISYRLKIQTKIMQFIYMSLLWRAFVVRFPQTIIWHSIAFESFDFAAFTIHDCVPLAWGKWVGTAPITLTVSNIVLFSFVNIWREIPPETRILNIQAAKMIINAISPYLVVDEFPNRGVSDIE